MIVEHSRINRIQGDIISVPATGISYGELATVRSRRGTSLAQVIRLRGDEVSLPRPSDAGRLR
jgi:V/A-type H+/Na+-transporting ATPase subunit B